MSIKEMRFFFTLKYTTKLLQFHIALHHIHPINHNKCSHILQFGYFSFGGSTVICIFEKVSLCSSSSSSSSMFNFVRNATDYILLIFHNVIHRMLFRLMKILLQTVRDHWKLWFQWVWNWESQQGKKHKKSCQAWRNAA